MDRHALEARRAEAAARLNEDIELIDRYVNPLERYMDGDRLLTPLGTILDREGVAVRTGNHCAQPVLEWFGVPATTRASIAFYNTRQDIDALVAGIAKVKEIFD